MKKLVSQLRQDYPTLTFITGHTAHWSPANRQITYTPQVDTAVWSLLHEVGHALLDHFSYDSDVNLVQKEAAAWEQATALAQKYSLVIDDNHVQACLDTYRDWLYKRSTCPTCERHGVQTSPKQYTCLNCQSNWSVTSARFCRPYRLIHPKNKAR